MARIDANRPHIVLREIYKHYIDFKDHFMMYGQDVIVIPAGYWENQEHELVVSFLDLQYGVSDLAKRKKEAFWYHIICDMKQEDVAEIMGITPVSVGQYTESALRQLAKRYFADNPDIDIDDQKSKKKSKKTTLKKD